jgi:hypothetical protein
VEILATMWWTWWNNRNKVRGGGDALTAIEITHRALVLAADSLEFGKSERGKYPD